MNTRPLEADTRLLIDKSLENLGWRLSGKDQNVYFERPKTEAERKKLRGKRPDYVLYSKENDQQPLIIIEAKKKGERIDTALVQGIHYAKDLGAPIVFATDGVFCKSYHTKFDKPPILNGEEVDEFLREALALKYLNAWEVNTVSPKVQYDRKELIKIFDEANNMLRGDGLRAGIERFGEFANILFLKLISESEDFKKLNGIHSDFDDMCHWDYIKNLKPNSRIDHINKIVYERLNALYKTDIFTPLSIRNPSILKDIMDKLDPLTLTDVDSDVKGDAFEYFLKESTATKNDLGEYFTPRHIVKTMVKLVNPQIGEKIYDPFCGTGGFLIESFRHIYNTMPRNEFTEKMLREQTIYGNEITNTARITKMNMILAGDGHSGISMQDSLANPVNGKYDIVLANMPYSQKTKYGDLYDLPSTNGDSICVQHCMKAISSTAENGRMAIVVPEGFLFRKDLAKTRELLLQNCNLQSIISLPQGVFLPYTGVKTNIIYATKVNQKLKSSKKRKDYWYFDVKSDGYTLDNHRRKLSTPSDIDKYLEYRKLDSDQKHEMLDIGFEIIPLDKVKANSFVLVGSRYREYKNTNFKYTANSLAKLENKNILSIVKGQSITKETAKDGIYPVIAGGQTSPYAHNDFNHDKDVITISASGAYSGFVWYHDFPIWASDCTVLKSLANNKLLTKYIYYVLKAKQEEIYTLQHGTGQPHIYPDDIRNIVVPIPPLNIQHQIINELDGYQKIIDGAKTVVQSYTPNITLPENCSYLPISDLCIKMTGGGTPSTKEKTYWNGNIPWITSADIDECNKITVRKYTTIEGIENSTSKIIPKGNVIIASRVGLGKIALNTYDVAINQDLQGLIIDTKKVFPNYFLYIYPSIVSQIKEKSRGTTIKGITKQELLELKVAIPSLSNQKEIIEQIESEQKLIESSKQLIEIFTKKYSDRISELFK